MYSEWSRGILGIAICYMTFVIGAVALSYFNAEFIELTKEQSQVEIRSNQAIAKRDVKGLTLTNNELERIYNRMKPLRNATLGIAAVFFLASIVHTWAVWQLTYEFILRRELFARVAALFLPILIVLQALAPQNESLHYAAMLVGGLTVNGVLAAIFKICRQAKSTEIAKSLETITWVWAAAYIINEFVARKFAGPVQIATSLAMLACAVYYSATLVKLWRRIEIV